METHSDHVLNGLRWALLGRTIEPDDVAIYFFNRRVNTKTDTPRVISVSADHKGNLSDWPEGFFDQSENDLAGLAGWV